MINTFFYFALALLMSLTCYLCLVSFETYATSSNVTSPENASKKVDSFNLMDISPDEKTLYVTNSGANELVVINATNSTGNLSEITRISVGNDPRGIAVTPDGKKAYVSNHMDNTVSVINTELLKVVKVIPVGSLPWGLDTSGDGKKLFVANWGDNKDIPLDKKNSITIIDTNNDTVLHNIALNASDEGGPFGVRSPPDIAQKWVAITLDYGNKLVLLNTDSYQTKEIDLFGLGVGTPTRGPMPIPWILSITENNKIIIAAGLGPTFFPVIEISCPQNEVGDFSTCEIDTSKKLEFTGEDQINEPWSVYSKGDKIYGVDMYNVAPNGTEQEEGSLLVWDANTLKLLHEFEHESDPDKVGIAPLDVIVTDDGRVFVSNSGTHVISNKTHEEMGIPFDYGEAKGKASISFSILETYATSSNVTSPENASKKVDSFNLMDISPDEKTLYVTNSGANELVVINATNSTGNLSEITRISVGNDPRGIAVTPDGKKAYVTNHFDDTVSVVNASTNKVIKVIPVGRHPWGLDTSSDGKKLFVANWGDDRSVPLDQKNSISVIDTGNDEVIHSIKLNTTDPGGPFAIRSPLNSTEKWIAVTMDSANKLVLINTDTYERHEIDLRIHCPCGDPWVATITNDNKVIIAAGNGPVFFPAIQVSCPSNPVDFSECDIDTSMKLDFIGHDQINEPWSVYSKGDKIYGVDMYNVAPNGTEQEEGSLLVWDANTLKLLHEFEHESDPDKVGIAPLDVIATDDGRVFVSNSGTHVISNRTHEEMGIPFDYGEAKGKASIALSALDLPG